MKNLLLASVAVLTLSAAVPAFAQDVVVGVEPQTTDADTNADTNQSTENGERNRFDQELQ